MKPGATLGLSHGFLLGVMQNDGVDFREDINVILNAPKVRPRLVMMMFQTWPVCAMTPATLAIP
jgi:ketol-acid reductoisomerase